MQVKKIHNWNLSYSEAIALQKKLGQTVQFIKLKTRLKTIAGIDCALSKDGQNIIASAVVLRIPTTEKGLWEPISQPDFEIIEKTTASQKLTFPYIPGLLSFLGHAANRRLP